MAVVQNKPTNCKTAQQQTLQIQDFKNLSWNIYVRSGFCTMAFFQVGKTVVVCQQVSQPEHVSSTEDHIKLWAVQLRSSLRHLRRLAETRLLQQKLTWREGNTEEVNLYIFSAFLFWSHASHKALGTAVLVCWSINWLVDPRFRSRLEYLNNS